MVDLAYAVRLVAVLAVFMGLLRRFERLWSRTWSPACSRWR
jgi:hypothetical protein